MTNKWRAGILTTTLTPLSSRRPQCQSWHSISSVLSCPARTLWPLPVDQHLQQPDHGPLCPQWCQSQLIPALGGGVTAIASSCPDSTWHPPQGWATAHGPPGQKMPGAGREPAGQLPTFLRALWPGQGWAHKVRRGEPNRGELESLTGWGGGDGWRDCGPFSAQRQPVVGTSCPSLSPFLSLAHRHRKARPHAAPSPSPRPHCPSPGQPRNPKAPSLGGHMTQACGLARSAFGSVVV